MLPSSADDPDMGKHERAVVQELEERTATLLNDPRAAPLPPHHPWAGHDRAFASALERDHGPITRAVHSGNSYNQPGDLQIAAARGTLYIELKASDSSGNIGTAANITQNALTEYGLFTGSPISWSSWRVRRRYDQRVSAILDELPAARRAAGIVAKGITVRKHANAGDPMAQRTKARAVEAANQDRLEYLEYLRAFPTDPKRVGEFVLAIFLGAHKRVEMLEFLSRNLASDPDALPRDYHVYFTNVRGGHVIVSSFPGYLISALSSVRNHTIVIPSPRKGKVTAEIVGNYDGHQVQLLRFVLHWKNVFIGIKTPCINVFLGSYARSLIGSVGVDE